MNLKKKYTLCIIRSQKKDISKECVFIGHPLINKITVSVTWGKTQ